MGIVTIRIEVANPSAPDKTVEVECLVDSGATYAVIPSAILEALGIKPYSEDEYCLANGERIRRKRGVAVFKYGGRVGGSDVIFGEEDDSQLVGALTLEALGLALDPFKRELRPMPMILGGWKTK